MGALIISANTAVMAIITNIPVSSQLQILLNSLLIIENGVNAPSKRFHCVSLKSLHVIFVINLLSFSISLSKRVVLAILILISSIDSW